MVDYEFTLLMQIPSVAHKWNAKPVLMASNAAFGGGRVAILAAFSRIFFFAARTLTSSATQARQGISVVSRGCLGQDNTYAEINIDVSESFSYIARGAIYLIQSRLATMGPLDIALTVEGRHQPDELPEALLAAITFNKIDVTF